MLCAEFGNAVEGWSDGITAPNVCEFLKVTPCVSNKFSLKRSTSARALSFSKSGFPSQFALMTLMTVLEALTKTPTCVCITNCLS